MIEENEVLDETEMLSSENQEKLGTEVGALVQELQEIATQIEKTKQLGAEAKSKAQDIAEIKPDAFHRKKVVKGIQESQLAIADATESNAQLSEQLFRNQTKMMEVAQSIVELGMVDIATNRAVVEFVKDAMQGGGENTLLDTTKEKLVSVVNDLKKREDILLKQRKQGERISDHDKRLKVIELKADDFDKQIVEGQEHDKAQDQELSARAKKDKEHDARLDAGDKRDEKQDAEIKLQQQKDTEHDRRLDAGDKKDSEQDKFLEEQRKRDVEHDELFTKAFAQISDLEDKYELLSNEVDFLKESNRVKRWIIATLSIAVIGVILGVLGIIL